MHEYENVNEPRSNRDYRLAIGFLVGTAAGVGLMMWLAPRSASELRGRIRRTTRDLGERASERYDAVTNQVGSVVEGLTRKGQAVRDDVADSVARGAREVERFAKAVKS